jgi:preprotein translocase subunit SecD
VNALRRGLVCGLLLFVASGCWLLPGLGSCVQADYRLVATAQQPITPETLAQVRTTLENRLNGYGVAAFAVRTVEPDTISVSYSASDGAAEVRDLISMPGVVRFVGVPVAFFNAIVEGQPLPPDMPVEPIFGGGQIAAARPGVTQAGLPAVDIELEAEAARSFDDYAAKHQGERFAIVLDGLVQSAPTINAARFNGQAQISGNFTPADVSRLVAVLRSGELPVPVEAVASSTRPCADAGI